MQLCVNAKISLLVNTVYIDMSTQTRNSGGGGRNQKKSNSSSGGGGGGDSITQASSKKTDLSKTEKEKSHPKPTAEQLRIAEITNSNKTEDPQMREKVATLIEMTQRSEEEVCCALNECDNNLERAVVFLLETLPVGAFETSSKKKKNKAANSAQDNAGGDGDWADGNANTDKREKSRNRNTSNRGGRGGTDSRGWRGREARENDRNSRGAGAERSNDDRNNDNYRSGPRPDGPRRGGIGSRGGGYVGRGGRGGGRMGGGGRGMGSRGERSGGGYSSRYNNNTNDDHREVELWDNTIAQNAEKQHQQSQDDAWGDWDNEEYVGSLKDSKVFTTSNLPNQTAASVLSSGLTGSGAAGSIGNELSAPPGLEHHLGTSVMGGTSATQSSHYNSLGVGNIDDTTSSSVTGLQSATTTPMMQYSAAVSSTPQMQQQSSAIGGNPLSAASALSGNSATLGASQYGSAVDTFTNAATAAANLVQQVQQQQQLTPQIKPPSTTLTAEQSQYFSSLTSQNTAAQQQQQQQQQQLAASYAQNSASVQYPPSYANVFNASSPGSGATAGSTITNDPTAQLTNSQQPAAVRRARAKLPPPSKIPQSAVEMPGDSSLNNIGFLDVQFGGLDFGNDDSFENISEKYNNSVNLVDSQQQQQVQQQQQQTQQKSSSQLGQSPQDVVSSYEQNKSVVQQQQSALTAGLQNTHLADTLSAAAAYSQRSANQQQQQSQQQAQQLSNSVVAGGNNALDQLTKNDPYSQTNNASASAYQSSYQTSANVTNKAATNAYQASVPSQGYGSSSYGNVQSSVANSYQPQSYGSYQQNSMNSYQQQQQQSATGTQGSSNVSNTVVGGGNTNSTQNIPSVGGSNSTGNASASANSSYLSSAYGSQQNAYQPSQSVYGSAGLSNNTGYSGSTSTSSSQYSNFSTTAKLKDTSAASNTSHYESVSSSNVISNSGSAVNSATSGVNSQNAVSSNTSNNSGGGGGGVGVGGSNNSHTGSNSTGVAGVINNSSASNVISQSVSGGGVNSSSANNTGNNSGTSVTGGSGAGGNSASSAAAAAAVAAAAAAAASGVSSSTNKTGGVSGSGVAPTGAGSTGASSGGTGSGSGTGGTGGSGMVPPNIQMVSQYIQTSMPYHYQHPVYSYEDLQMMQQRVPHVQGYYDLNYTSPSLGAGRDNLGSVAYSTMTDGRFARTDNNSSPVSNVSSTMSQQASSGGPMLNVPYAYFYGGNVMPGSFQYGTPAIYPQIPAANTASGGQFPKPSYNTGYGSTNYDALTQASQDYTKGSYPSSVTQQTKSQNVTNPPQAGAGSDITSSMYSKGHVALNKVNSYEKQNFHSGTPPPFNMANTQTAGGTSAQPYGMYLPTMPAAGHHMIHPPMHQMDGRIHSSSRDSNSTGQRQPTSSQSKSATKQGYSPSYWTGQN